MKELNTIVKHKTGRRYSFRTLHASFLVAQTDNLSLSDVKKYTTIETAIRRKGYKKSSSMSVLCILQILFNYFAWTMLFLFFLLHPRIKMTKKNMMMGKNRVFMLCLLPVDVKAIILFCLPVVKGMAE